MRRPSRPAEISAGAQPSGQSGLSKLDWGELDQTSFVEYNGWAGGGSVISLSLSAGGAGDLLVALEALAKPSVRPAIGEGYHALAIATGAVSYEEETAETA